MGNDLRDVVVYEHWSPVSGAPFYVGIGTKRRAYEYSAGRNKAYCQIARELRERGLRPETRILADGLTRDEAVAIEKNHIALLGRREDGGLLVNISEGGRSGHSISVRSRISMAHKGKTLSVEHRAKLSAAHIGKKYGPPSTETRKKISIANKGRNYPPISAETRAKLSASRRGKKRSAETCAKLSDSIRRAYADHPEWRVASAKRRARLTLEQVEETRRRWREAKPPGKKKVPWGWLDAEAERLGIARGTLTWILAGYGYDWSERAKAA
ncbi:MAG: NUMOD3 domain-containing DNA-binding protein [Hyphomicrobiales bacterium]|nr:NUMOD3 domain-containing DNA-binding protein [Hyphomicrobiales bacterium]